jgi:DNA-binding transcriptional LysR family regulator
MLLDPIQKPPTMQRFVARIDQIIMDRITASQVFLNVAERGSMTATAEALGMSRAMITRYLAHMEAWAGARLLHRTTRRISPTPAYLAAHGTPRLPQELALHNCLTHSYFGKSLWQFERQGQQLAVPVGGNLSANESRVLLAAALEGAGIAMQPVYSAEPLMASGRLVALLPEWRPQALGVYGVYSSRRQMPAALRAMLDFLAQRFSDPRHWPPAGPPAPRRGTARARSRTA